MSAAADRTLDAFHRGAFHACQPRKGHRSGSDALLLAAALPEGASGRLADLGAGSGVAAFAALAANPGLEAVLVEIDAEAAACARASLELPQNAILKGRASVIEADAAASGAARTASGLADAAFDFAIANPPYHLPHERGSPDPRRVLAHRLPSGGLEPWVRTAAAIVRPGGMFCLIWRADRLEEALAALKGRFGGAGLVALHSGPRKPASRIVIRAIRGSRAPLAIHPGVVLHDPANRPTELAQELLNGLARLPFGD